MTYLKYSATLFVVKCFTVLSMPTRKRRIGFIPKYDVLKIIDNISEKENLSNSKVVNILIEEALFSRGLIYMNPNSNNKLNKNFMEEIADFKKNFYEDDFLFENDYEGSIKPKDKKQMYKSFIQFLHFQKMMKIFDKFN